jgi:hypothetical protein
MKKTMAMLVMLVALTGCNITDKTTSPKETAVNNKVVGVYDSRAIALAYWKQIVDGQERFRLDDIGMTPQDKAIMMHQQVFSYHEPVQALKFIADKLPGIMEQAGINVIVSKWDKEELAKYKIIGSGWDDNFAVNNPNVVDVTITLVQIYDPKATLQEYNEGFGKTQPAPFDTDWLKVKE